MQLNLFFFYPKCLTCPGKCKTNQDCAECVGFKKGKYAEAECAEKCMHVEQADVLEGKSPKCLLIYF
jgi:hypothetical protein